MRYQQQHPSRARTRRRQTNRKNVMPGMLTTALSVGTVLVLIAVTFVADWLRTPELSVSTLSPFLSPNGDLDHDTVTVNYTLTEDADVSAQVFDDSGRLVRDLLSVDAQSAGQYFVTWDGKDDLGQAVLDGRYRLEVSAKAAVRAAKQSVALQLDTRAPALQVANLPDGLRVGEELLIIQGVTDPDAVVWISGDPRPIAVDTQGRFSVQRRLNEGRNLFDIQAADTSGNTAHLTREIVLVTQPPDIVITSPLEGAWLDGQLLSVAGQATPGTTLSINGQPVLVDNDGQFQYQLLLNEGENHIEVEATDDVGNRTSLDRVVYLKTQAPGLTLNVQEGETFSDHILHLTGHTDPGTFVKINNQVVPVSAMGDFQLAVNLFEGENTILVEAQDQAGNSATLTRHVNYSTAQPLSGVEKMFRNLSELPPLTLPLLLVVPLILAMIFYRQQQISMLLSVEQNTFTPGLPNEGKTLALMLDLDKPAKVTLEVLDRRGRVIATLLHNRRRSARAHHFSWDGYDDFGYPVDPGEYTVQATAGTTPIQVTSAVQIDVQEDLLVHQQATGVARSTLNTYRSGRQSRSTRR